MTQKKYLNRLHLSGGTILSCLLSFASHAHGETIWIHAAQAKDLHGPMVLGQKTGVVEDGTIGDFVASASLVNEGEMLDGYAEYQVKIPQTATYYIWARLRYPFGTDDSFALIPDGEKPTADMSRCLGNSGVGVREWHWDSQGTGAHCTPGTGRLAMAFHAGELTFRVYPREARARRSYNPTRRPALPLFNPRLNILCLTTDPHYVPTDEDAQHALKMDKTRVDLRTFKSTPTRLPAVSDKEWAHLGKKKIPDWLRCPRMFTKDFWRDDVAFRHAGDIALLVREIAANQGDVFRIGGYWGGDAYFQSKVTPPAPGLGSLDFLREAIDEGKRAGIKIIMYMNPTALYAEHPLYPEVAIRDAAGERSDKGYALIPGAPFICNTNPKFRVFLAGVLTEVFTKYGPDGLYVDGLGTQRCFCEHCRRKYRQMFGEEMPVEKIDQHPKWIANWWEMSGYPFCVGDPGDPDAQRYTRFFYQNQIELMRLVFDSVKKSKPDAAVLIHTWPKEETIAYYEATLTEIYLEEPWKHPLWKFGELANYSNAFPVPVIFNIYLDEHGTEADALVKSLQGLANGCFPNHWSLLGMKPVFKFMRENAEYLDFAKTRPTPCIALVRGIIDSPAQDIVKARTDVKHEPVHDRFLAPYAGLYAAIIRERLPVVSLQQHDFQHRLDGFKVLCLANEACLTDDQIAAVRKFVAAGGGLVATHETSLYDESGNRRSDFGLADVFGAHYEAMLPASERHIRSAGSHPVTDGLGALASIIHDDTCVATRVSQGKTLATLVGDDSTATPVPAVVAHEYGAGRVVYVPGRLDAIQCDRVTPAIERLFGNAVRWVARDETKVWVDAPAPINVVLFDQPDRRIVHLVNLNGDTEYKTTQIQPIPNINVQLDIPAGRHVEQLHRLWDKAAIPFKTNGHRIQFTLDKIGYYEAVVMDLQTP